MENAIRFRSAAPSSAADAGDGGDVSAAPAATLPTSEGNGVSESTADAPSSDAAGPPVLVRDLASAIVDKGSPVTLECQIGGNPADVVWLRNGKEVKTSGDVSIETSGSTFRLSLKNPSAEDSGTYQCDARQAGQSVSSVCTLLVNGQLHLLSKCRLPVGGTPQTISNFC